MREKRKVSNVVRKVAEKVVGRNAMKRYEVDHKIPIADGGKDALANLQVIPKGAHLAKTKAENVVRGRKGRSGRAR